MKQRIGRDQAVRIALQKYSKRVLKAKKKVDRKEWDKLAKRASDVDNDNLKWLKKQVADYGWPPLSTVGKRTAEEWFILVLHADRDREFQHRCVELMEKLPDSEILPGKIERLKTRSRYDERKTQSDGKRQSGQNRG